MSLLGNLFGDANKRYVAQLGNIVSRVSEKEAWVHALSDDALKIETARLRQKIADWHQQHANEIQDFNNSISETLDDAERQNLKRDRIAFYNAPLDDVLPEAYALVREAAVRTLSQRHFDVQVMGGVVLHRGQVAEMKTGEGKTLTSTLAVYLNALTGRGVHVVTVNDYLARRDAIWMAQIFHILGLTVGVIAHDSAYLYDPTHTNAGEDTSRDAGVALEMDFLRTVTRKEAYGADITYGTNNEFGFDYLRDNMVSDLDQKVQRELHFAIVDEVDSILIDEARTPLIISAPDNRPTDRYYQYAELVKTLNATQHYSVDEKLRAVSLTEDGIAAVEKALGVENLYIEEGIQTVHHIEQALKAQALFMKDKDYTIQNGEVIIVDEFTGRMLHGRRYSEGLHQAIEAKEGVAIQRESKTMATITFQNYFRLYHKLAGMTGTAETEAEELVKIYNLEVTAIPTNREMVRKDLPDRIYKSQEGKLTAVVKEIKERHHNGQPVLVGTISIERNEHLGNLLEQEGLSFSLLNAKQHEREAEVIAQAGTRGAITIATNMAGRGVDIILGGKPYDEKRHTEIVGLGGLHVIGTERHESRRIDNQLRGRAGRQGDAGSSQFYVSLEDDLMRIFGAERIKGLMKSWPEDSPIENSMISKSIESAQKKVEGHNFDIRKHLVEYDDVANKQRMNIYGKRNNILSLVSSANNELIEIAQGDISIEVENTIVSEIESKGPELTLDDLAKKISPVVACSSDQLLILKESVGETHSTSDTEKYVHFFKEKALAKFTTIIDFINQNFKNGAVAKPDIDVIKTFYIRSIDVFWVEHLETIQYLRTGIGLRGYGQRDPLVEYKRESRQLFENLLSSIRRQFVHSIMNIATGPISKVPQVKKEDEAKQLIEEKAAPAQFTAVSSGEAQQPIEHKHRDDAGKKVGRNDPCYCGSGRKYKKCHGA